MKKPIVAVICGGDSSEYEISISGAKYIYQQLCSSEFLPFIVYISKKEWVVVVKECRVEIDKNDFSFTFNGEKYCFDYAFINIHGTPGENGVLQSYFDLLEIPYSSCGVDASVITFNKMFCKRVLAGCAVAMAKDFVIAKGDAIDAPKIVEQLGLPLFVKPNNSGSSFGVTKVKAADDIEGAVEAAYSESNTVLLEQFVEGREFSQGVYSVGGEVIALPLTEIISKGEFFDYAAKYNGESTEVTPADIEQSISLEIALQAKKIYKLLDCRGFVRIDFIVSGSCPYFIELNSVPGMSSESIIPQQVAAAGMKMNDFLSQIIKNSYKI